jgi:AraC-like DNA-binding protein
MGKTGREIQTASVDEAERIQSAMREPMSGEHTGGARFTWHAHQFQLGEVRISASRYTGDIRGAMANVGNYWVSITTGAGGQVRQVHATTAFAAGRSGNVLTPGLPADIVLGDGFAGILVGVPPARVATVLAALHGEPIALPRFELGLDFETPVGADVAHLVRFLAAEGARDGGVLGTPAIAVRLEEALIHAMLRLPRNAAPAPAAPAAPFALDLVRRIEDYLAARRASPVTLTELAGVGGVSVRTIQAAFRRHRGYTPMGFLRARRFELARARLATPTTATVTEIALDCGFTHLGRFSTEYRARFGEPPSVTRRAAR